MITALSALVRGHTTPQQHATEETQNYIHKLLLRLGPSSGSCRQGASPAVTCAHDYIHDQARTAGRRQGRQATGDGGEGGDGSSGDGGTNGGENGGGGFGFGFGFGFSFGFSFGVGIALPL